MFIASVFIYPSAIFFPHHYVEPAHVTMKYQFYFCDHSRSSAFKVAT